MITEKQPIKFVRSELLKIWINPIFCRYCQSRLRFRGLGLALLVSLLISGFIFFISRAIGLDRMHASVSDAARGAIIPLFIFQALILFVLGTAQVSGGMTAETDEGVIDYQRLIPMRPISKVLGYLFGLPIREYAMFFVTLPFTIWALWQGMVSPSVWVPLYVVFFSSSLTYHLTGLVTGTVVKNRRWAFLISIGLVFCLYTIVPQMARFGLVFFKYLTITPVFQESLSGILPSTAGAIVATGQNLAPEAKFFNLGFPEAFFTIFCQGGLILTFITMLCRRWSKAESLLLSKVWATCVFAFVQILLLGNAIPLIDPGNIFPSREISKMILELTGWVPKASEAVVMSGIYGLVTLLLLFMLTRIITPSTDNQIREWRRVRKLGGSALPVLGDASSAFGWIIVMALLGASVLMIFILVMISSGIGFHALLEAKGGRALGMAIIFIGIVPLMVGAVLSTSNDRLIPAAVWIAGISPISAPVYASASLLSISELPLNLARSVPRAFCFWQLVSLFVSFYLVVQLRRSRKSIAKNALPKLP